MPAAAADIIAVIYPYATLMDLSDAVNASTDPSSRTMKGLMRKTHSSSTSTSCRVAEGEFKGEFKDDARFNTMLEKARSVFNENNIMKLDRDTIIAPTLWKSVGQYDEYNDETWKQIKVSLITIIEPIKQLISELTEGTRAIVAEVARLLFTREGRRRDSLLPDAKLHELKRFRDRLKKLDRDYETNSANLNKSPEVDLPSDDYLVRKLMNPLMQGSGKLSKREAAMKALEAYVGSN